MKRTPLYAEHKKLGARMVDFNGWDMPVQYTGVIAEHTAVRTAAGLFDVSHMGEVRLRGIDAGAAVDRLFTNDRRKLTPGKAQYSAMLNERGGILDDLIVYMRGPEEYFLCINAGNTASDFAWLTAHIGDLRVTATNESEAFGLIALQGPKSPDIMKKLATDAAPGALAPFHFCDATLAGASAMVARTGYTGEKGYEIFCRAEDAARLWTTALDVGAAFGISPAGLGARDTLRLEMGYALHGHDITPEITPLEAGLGWDLSFRRTFIGADVLAAQRRTGVTRTLVGLTLAERGIAREGCPILDGSGTRVGAVTSGTMSPSLKIAIALGYVPPSMAAPGTEVGIDIRGSVKRARITRPPFYHPAA